MVNDNLAFFKRRVGEINKLILDDPNDEKKEIIEELDHLYSKLINLLNAELEERKSVNDTSNGMLWFNMAIEDLLRSYVTSRKAIGFKY